MRRGRGEDWRTPSCCFRPGTGGKATASNWQAPLQRMRGLSVASSCPRHFKKTFCIYKGLGTDGFEESHLSSLVEVHGLQVSVHPGLTNTLPPGALLLQGDQNSALRNAAPARELPSLLRRPGASPATHSPASCQPAQLECPTPGLFSSAGIRVTRTCDFGQEFLVQDLNLPSRRAQKERQGVKAHKPALLKAQPTTCQQHSSETQNCPPIST